MQLRQQQNVVITENTFSKRLALAVSFFPYRVFCSMKGETYEIHVYKESYVYAQRYQHMPTGPSIDIGKTIHSRSKMPGVLHLCCVNKRDS